MVTLKKSLFYKLLFIIAWCADTHAQDASEWAATMLSADQQAIHGTLDASDASPLIAEDLKFLFDREEFSIEHVATSQQPSLITTAEGSRAVFSSPVTFDLIVRRLSPQVSMSHLTVHYQRLGETEPSTIIVDIPFELPPVVAKKEAPKHTGFVQRIIHRAEQAISNARTRLQNQINQTHSRIAQLLFIFLLGLLMSFTPCILPMVPITMGILQPSAGSTLSKNLLVALSYAAGVATTFALLGLITALGGAHFGFLMGNPIFIGLLIAFFTYMGLSMIGLYELYVPRFLQKNHHTVRKGSVVSAFFFGALSGTVASPCVSPGLALLLALTAQLNNPLLAFCLLFVFGLGLSTPLLCIALASTSATLLPTPGMWMLEVKRIFGIPLLGMACYYLQLISSPIIAMGAALGVALTLGVWYLGASRHTHTKGLRWYRFAAGCSMLVIVIALSVLIWHRLTAAKSDHANTVETLSWASSYQAARERALAENKLVFMDFGADWCTACKKIERTLLHNSEVVSVLEKMVCAKIDCTKNSDVVAQETMQRFGVQGLPTCVVVDPTNESIRARWSAELEDFNPRSFSENILTIITE